MDEWSLTPQSWSSGVDSACFGCRGEAHGDPQLRLRISHGMSIISAASTVLVKVGGPSQVIQVFMIVEPLIPPPWNIVRKFFAILTLVLRMSWQKQQRQKVFCSGCGEWSHTLWLSSVFAYHVLVSNVMELIALLSHVSVSAGSHTGCFTYSRSSTHL